MKYFLSAAAVCLTAAVSLPAQAGQTFDAVKARGTVTCGVHTGLGGFGAPDAKGEWAGLDVDVCRAVAAAVFGDAKKVRYVPLSAQQRLTALQSGEIDLLSRNTTWTMSRDTASGLLFTAVNFYDGQGFLVNKKLGVKGAKDLNGATVCVQTGTTTELNLADFARANKIELKPVTIENFEEAANAFVSGRCDAMTSDGSQLAAIRANQTPNPDDYVILPERISKEPLATAVRQGDDQWFNIVKWTFQAMIEAEERGVTSANVDDMTKSSDPNVQRLLGVTAGMGKGLGVDDKWAYNIIKQVGNYGESFERNVGHGSKLKLDRGLNALWTRGGMMYAIPVR
ncbi:MAG TPA: amino acid ABC transporter substrate-binding protein [Rhodospirillaceae bacterium]|nr:amino acid ABC transporter substrate-binding protein [Rhodospirillaceae bacterium]